MAICYACLELGFRIVICIGKCRVAATLLLLCHAFRIRLQELRVRTLWVRMVFTAFDVVRGWAALNGFEEVPVDMRHTPDLL